MEKTTNESLLEKTRGAFKSGAAPQSDLAKVI